MARILIVEDEPNNAEVAVVTCTADGHDVAVAGNGIEALQMLAERPFDLVLADVIMPFMDGLTLTNRIRASHARYAEIPIIGVTARAGKQDLAELLNAGMNRVVTKPYRAGTLRQEMATILDRGRAIGRADAFTTAGNGLDETA